VQLLRASVAHLPISRLKKDLENSVETAEFSGYWIVDKSLIP